jgi:rubrerythrin
MGVIHMKPHKRNGKAAKARRQKQAMVSGEMREQHLDYVRNQEPGLLDKIFGKFYTCNECGVEVLVGADCQTPHCKSLRNEASDFYDEVTEDHVQIKGARMYSGLDY